MLLLLMLVVLFLHWWLRGLEVLGAARPIVAEAAGKRAPLDPLYRRHLQHMQCHPIYLYSPVLYTVHHSPVELFTKVTWSQQFHIQPSHSHIREVW